MKRIDVRELEASHRTLDQAIHELERRGLHMTPEERLRAVELKKLRLVARDLVESRRLSVATCPIPKASALAFAK